MKNPSINLTYKKLTSALRSFILSKSKLVIAAVACILLFSAMPFFNGSGLPSAKVIGPYANNAFPESVEFNLDATYRVAFPDLTFTYPITFRAIPNQSKLVIGQLNGVIYWFEDNETTTVKNELIDLSNEVGLVSDGGLLGLTIHPEFDAPTNPKNYFYVYYATKNGAGQDSPPFGGYTGQSCDYSVNEYEGNYLVLERFEVDPSTMGIIANSRTDILRNRMYGTTHYGGGLDFGDDGFLYLTTGDMASWERSQDIINNMAGGVLRIDVDKDPTKSHAPVRTKPADVGFAGEVTGVEYWIPNDNPFSDTTSGSTTNIYGQPNLTTADPNDVYQQGDFFEEYYSLGLRNPFRMTKDRITGEFYIGDVGLNSREEINVLEAGANFGWPLYEGVIAGPGCYDDLFNNMTNEEPLTSFGHDIANSITGGYVYRGSAIPELYGKYICADYGGGSEIFSVDTSTGDFEQIATFLPQNIISFGEDTEGELYILNLGENINIHKMIDSTPNSGPIPQLLSETGVFTNLSTLEVADGFVPYELYESFWSDGALKKRWIAVPNNDGVHSGTAEQINYSEYGDWEFPEGTVIIKHFDLRIDDNDPSVTRKIETRISVQAEDGDMYFLTYNWNEDQTDAVLQSTALDEPVEITTTTGGTRTQTWHFPSNSDCLNCHNQVSNRGLGLKSRYLNTDYTYDETGITSNQLVTLSHLGIINEPITDNDTSNIFVNKALNDTEATLDEKARSYMDLNCAYCHRNDNNIRTDFDLRSFNSLEATELLNAGILSPLGVAPDEEIVFPGDASKSILYHRMNSVDVGVMMPPLSKTLVDQPAVDIIEQWINQLDENSLNVDNNPNPTSNLALLPSAVASGSVSGERGTPTDILYDPVIDDFRTVTRFGEYGEEYGDNLGTVDAENGFFWRVDWPQPKFVNYITFGGAYPNQRQPNTMWRVSYLNNGTWITIEEGQGGWIDNDTGNRFTNTSIYEWNATNEAPVYAEAIRLQLYSDGVNDLIHIHVRGRGGSTNQYGSNDVNTEPKATLIQFLPVETPTTIDSVVAGNQTGCDPADNTYSQELIISYTNEPETGSLIVNNQTFPITGSPQTVTLTDLTSDGLDVNVEAEFTEGYDTFYKSTGSVFTAPDNCIDLLVGVDEVVTITGDYEVVSGGNINILEGGSLTITGNLTINGDVTLNSISDKFSSLIVNGTSTGNIKYKRHVNAYNGSTGNDLVSPPVTDQTFGAFSTDNPNLFENSSNTNQKLFGPFNEPAGTYQNYSYDPINPTTLDAEVVINKGVGYRAARDTSEDGVSGTTLTFTGEVETNGFTLPITESATSFSGWNLIGNPYPSYLDFETFFNLNKTELDGSVYQAVYGYDGNATNGWTILNNLSAENGALIAPGQGFFVKAKSGGGTITFTPAMRVNGTTDDFIPGRVNLGFVKVQIDNSVTTFETDVYFNTNATLGLDPGYDASLFGGSAPDYAIYTHLVEQNTGTPMAIQTLGENDMNDVVIPLGIHATQGENVTVSISEMTIPSTINVYLEDTSNNTFTLLNSNTYSFVADTDITQAGRFFLRMESSVLNTAEQNLDSLSIYTNSSDKTIVIEGELQNPTIFTLYDIHGRVIITKNLETDTTSQNVGVENLAEGIYIVQLQNKMNQKRIKKLVIR